METVSKIRVLIADDQQLLLTMYEQILDGYNMHVVGKCKTPKEAVEKYRELHPNVLLLDIRFGNGYTGFDALEEILSFDKHANVVVISQFDHGPYIQRALNLGAKSFLTKDCDPEMLYTAVKAVSVGEKFLIPAIKEKIVDLFTNPEPDPKTVLSAEDFELFMLLAEGKTNEEISEMKKWTLSFVSTHRQKILHALKIERPQHISRLAIRHGYMAP